jgi:hypothetical protein
MTERRLVRWVLFSVPVLCAVQWAVVRYIGEPYPAIMGPSFASLADSASRKNPVLVIQRTDGTSVSRPAYDIFAGFPDSVAVALVNKGLLYSKELSPDAAGWLWSRVTNLDGQAASASIQWSKGGRWLGELAIK